MATRYVTYTYVDVASGVPVTVEPARNGPTAPAGVAFLFALESQYPTATPTFYGKTDGATDLPGILSVITKAQSEADYSAEMDARAALVDPYAHFIPVSLFRQRLEKLGIWDDFSAYLSQFPSLGWKVVSLEHGIDPAYPDLIVSFDNMDVPQSTRNYLLADPSVGVPDV